MIIRAPAKINLFLEVNRRLGDGYHAISSLMQTVSLFDTLTLEPRASGVELACDLPSLPTDDRNLAVRAALLLKKALGVRDGVRITLKKKIPLGSGLGGGSSDAAAVLKGLLKLWERHLPAGELVSLAARLGADVPFFLRGGIAAAGGIGEKLAPFSGAAPAFFLLVYPGYPVSTGWVYENIRFPLTRKQKINKIKALIESGRTHDQWGQYLFNRLEEIVFPAYPEIRHIKELLASFGCRSLMSGSGSTVFGIVPSREAGRDVQSKLKKYPWNSWLVESVS